MPEQPEIVYVDIDSLTEWEHNPRDNEEAVPEVARSIKEYGFLQPMVVDQFNVVYAGNTRLKACRLLGIKKVPVVRPDLPAEKLKAFAIADNKTHEIAHWDYKKLLATVSLEEIREIPGFGQKDMERLNGLLLKEAHIPKIEVEEKGVSKVTHPCPKCTFSWTA
jgi:ParB-like chromosome segregation protein Spo0J